jgi:hypothetical protein
MQHRYTQFRQFPLATKMVDSFVVLFRSRKQNVRVMNYPNILAIQGKVPFATDCCRKRRDNRYDTKRLRDRP